MLVSNKKQLVFWPAVDVLQLRRWLWWWWILYSFISSSEPLLTHSLHNVILHRSYVSGPSIRVMFRGETYLRKLVFGTGFMDCLGHFPARASLSVQVLVEPLVTWLWQLATWQFLYPSIINTEKFFKFYIPSNFVIFSSWNTPVPEQRKLLIAPSQRTILLTIGI